MPNDGQLPVEVVRDLLGIARAMYAAFQGMGPEYGERLMKLRGVGYQLQLALEKAAKGGPGTFAHRSAWLISEKAAADLAEMVDAFVPARALVRAAGERLAKKKPSLALRLELPRRAAVALPVDEAADGGEDSEGEVDDGTDFWHGGSPPFGRANGRTSGTEGEPFVCPGEDCFTPVWPFPLQLGTTRDLYVVSLRLCKEPVLSPG